jgi:toxin ParE1/3/4
MEKPVRKVVYSSAFYKDSQSIYLYGKETFGKVFADLFIEELLHTAEGLSFQFNLHPECRFLPTKSKKYRNIILGKYLIVYRIEPFNIEVLRAFHSSQSIRKIKKSRSVKI